MIVLGHELLDDVDPAKGPAVLKVRLNAGFNCAVKALDYSRLLVALTGTVLAVVALYQRGDSRGKKNCLPLSV